jgi:polyisoprenyl-phosphate glycosyltransferase
MNLPIDQPLLSIVIPCHNEAAGLAITVDSILRKLNELSSAQLIHADSYVLLIDDGSRDPTWKIIEQHAGRQVKGLKLSNNVGHQKALIAGLHYVANKCDCSISMDADLQDDLQVIDEMVKAYKQGNQVVYGARNNRDVDSAFKKKTAQLFYRVLKWMNINIIYNHADFRLASKNVLIELKRYEETHLFLRGIFPLIGFTHCVVYYERKDRQQGKTSYSLRKMVRLAIDGITSFSGFPLKLITIIGFTVFIGCILAIIWVFIVMIAGKNIPGWSSITLPMYFLGGIQLLALGIIGEYVNKIFQETKKRPLYHIEEIV